MVLRTNVNVASYSDLANIISSLDTLTTARDFTITFTGDITLTADLPAINLASGVTLKINGDIGGARNFILSGDGRFRGLLVYSGVVEIDNLSIVDAKAQGGAGSGGGGGGAGLGGGLFVASNAAVTLDGVSFLRDIAVGGDGGVANRGSVPGGGGGGGLGGRGGVSNTLSGGGGGVGAGASGGSGPTQNAVASNGQAGLLINADGGGSSNTAGGATGGGGGAATDAGGFIPGGGGGGGVAGASADFAGIAGGRGGFGGGGGGGGVKIGAAAGAAVGGAGGFGGGGGGGGLLSSGGVGGFGGGGGGPRDGSTVPGGFGGGTGLNSAGGGGLGAGGAIFVQEGGALTVKGAGVTLTADDILGIAASGGNGAGQGSAYGKGIFVQGSQSIVFAPGAGQTIVLAEDISDMAGSVGGAVGSGGLVMNGPGVLRIQGAQSFTGDVSLNGGTLTFSDDASIGGGKIVFGPGAQTLRLDGAAMRAQNAPIPDDEGGQTFADQLRDAPNFAARLSGLGLGDKIDFSGVAFNGAHTAALAGAQIKLLDAGGVALWVINLDSAASVAGLSLAVSNDGAGGDLITVSQAAPAPPVAGGATTTPSTPTPVRQSSQEAGLSTIFPNIARALGGTAEASSPSSSLYAQFQAATAINAQVDSGKLSVLDAQNALFHLVDGTTSVANIAYAFFTGATPTAQGLNYLVHSTDNGADLNDPAYSGINTENRYINFALNLGTGKGEGAAAFKSGYDALSLNDAAAKAYAAVFGPMISFGVTGSSDKIAAILNAPVPDGRGGTETRAQYFLDAAGGSAIGQKAALVGWLLADSVHEGFGVYQQANLHYLQALANGTTPFSVDLLAIYGPPVTLTGQPTPDLSLRG